jgi:D-psicose/D-tagatose/L-ribulose 3-epimerase
VKIGINLLLWTGHVTTRHAPLLQALRDTGFDGVEVPIFDTGDPGHYRILGGLLDALGLQRTASAVIPDSAHNPLSADAAHRRGAVEHLTRVIDCAAALGASMLVGPYYQPLGLFSGAFPREEELERCAEVHRTIMPLARAAGLGCAIEPLNRFEAYLLNTCDQGIAYARRVGAPDFGLLYDTFHAHIEERDPIAALRAAHAAGVLSHVHISENDRGVPGRGHARIRETIQSLRTMDYGGWLTIEAFGRAVPELAAATRVWRDFFHDPEEVYTDGYRYIRECWGS